MKFFLVVAMLLIGSISLVCADEYTYNDYAHLIRSEYVMKSEELRTHYDSIYVYYRKGNGDFIEYAFVVAKKNKEEFVLMYILPGKIFNRFKSLIVDISKTKIDGRIVGLPMSYLQKPFSPVLLIADTIGNLRISNPFAYLRRDYGNNTVEILELAP